MEIKYFDVPYIHQPEDEGFEFIKALNIIRESKPTEISHYGSETINMILQ
jgi:hypothetical protein